MMAAIRTGGEAIVDALLAHGVDTLFGLPGIQNDWLYNALFDARDRIRVVHTRHEQGAAYMALGYALARGDIAVYNVVPGPGFLNTTAALATAYARDAPVLCLTGQIPRATIGRELGVLHEIPDQLGVLRSLTKWAARINTPGEAPAVIGEAFRQLRSGRPRPVGVEVPMDVLAERALVEPLTAPLPVEVPAVDPQAIDEAVARLRRARHPLIFVGGGAQGVSAEVRQLAELLQAPVASYRTGRGVLDSRHYLSVVQPQAHPLWKDVDVAVVIGSNMRDPAARLGRGRGSRRHSDRRRSGVALALRHSGCRYHRARGGCASALDRRGSPPQGESRPSRREEMQALGELWKKTRAFLAPQIAFLEPIRHALGEDGILVDELTQVGFSSRVADARLQAANVHLDWLSGNSRLRIPDGAGCEARSPRGAGDLGDR